MLDMIDREIQGKVGAPRSYDQDNLISDDITYNISNSTQSIDGVAKDGGTSESYGLRRLRKVLNDDTKFEEYIFFFAWGGDRRSEEFNSFQVANQQLEKVGQGKVTYILKRLERDHPDILAAYQRGDVVSANLLSHYRPPDPSTPIASANALVASHKA